MRWSETVIPTLRDDPQEAEIASHRLMLRAGLIRKLAGGLYTFLPLGLRALRKLEQIVREEMDRAGALEVLLPALQPREIWDQSKRYEVMGDVMFKLRDRQDRTMVLGPTHEEVITQLASRELKSYRQFPKIFYQIQTKFRDEIRPRFGLIRAKEFIMKDAYSFDTGWDEADASYQAMYNAYSRIFERCGLKTTVVEADTGTMGGKWSHEFMALSESGEDSLVECDSCKYAANLERAERSMVRGQRSRHWRDNRACGATRSELATPKAWACPATGEVRGQNGKEPEEVATPGMKTIEQVSCFLKCGPERLIKTLIHLVDGKPIAILIPGDRDVNESKVSRALNVANVALADAQTIEKVTGAPVGFAGPVGLNIPIYADVGLNGYEGAVTGANKIDAHLVDVNLDRDTEVEAYHDLCLVRDGDPCPHCKGVLHEKRGIEVGHVFKLGTKYSESFDAFYLDLNGQRQPIVMGCYGIGVTRTLQAVIEQSRDENGIVWPMSVAPYRVLVLALNPAHQESMQTAEALVRGLEEKGIDVLLDDRDERPGVKFKDADLLGIPVRAVVSERSLAKQNVEIKLRTQEMAELVNVSEAETRIVSLCVGK